MTDRQEPGYDEALVRGVEAYDGKYRFYLKNGDFRVFVDRHGEPWLEIEKGHKAILALMQDLDAAREKIKELEQNLQNERDAAPEKEFF